MPFCSVYKHMNINLYLYKFMSQLFEKLALKYSDVVLYIMENYFIYNSSLKFFFSSLSIMFIFNNLVFKVYI